MQRTVPALAAKPAGFSGARSFQAAVPRARASRVRAVVVRAQDGNGQIPFIPASQVKGLINDKGFVFWDIRTPEEHAEGAKRYMKNVPVAFMTEKGPRMNNKWKPYFEQSFPNRMSRVIIACDDGTDRSELAYGLIADLGYSSVKVVEGGIFAVLEVDPLDSKDKAPKWRLTGQTSGVRYAYNDGEGDDSA